MSHFAARQFYDRYWDFRAQRGDTTASNRVKLRHEQTLEFLVHRFPHAHEMRLLDLGCGDGIMGQLLTARDFHVTGVDVSARALEIARPHYAHVQPLDLDRDPVPDSWRGAFDAVICLEVLEHLEKPADSIRTTWKLCRPGGCAVFSYPNIFSWKNRWAFLHGRWPHGYTTYDPREHLHAFELPQLRTWIGDAGFELIDLKITPDLPRSTPLRRIMFNMRNPLARFAPTLWAMQINLFAAKPPA